MSDAGVLAGAWIAFAVIVVLLLVFSVVFTRFYQDKHDREWVPTVVTMSGLFLVLVTVCLVPVDIFLFASTTDPQTGIKQPWATADEIANQTTALTVLYYVLFSVLMVYSFIVIPFAYFYYEEWDDGITTKKRVLGALKYTAFAVVIFLVLLLLGLFLKPGEAQPTDPEWYKSLLEASNIVRAIAFMVAVLALIGYLIFVTYTAYGIVAWPLGMIRGRPLPQTEEIRVADDLDVTRERSRAIKAKYLSGKKMSKNDQRELEELERKERLLQRRSNTIEVTNKSWWSTLVACLRPFEMLFGLFFLLLSLLIFVSLLLASVDRAVHSICGTSCGFVINNPQIFNPFNSLLVYSSQYFPLDYVILVSIIAYFFFATVAGIVKVGIRFLWVSMYSIRLRGTAPQGLLLTCLLLILSLLCLNIVLTSIAPQYTSYGFQTYCPGAVNLTVSPCAGNTTALLFCDISAPIELCTPTVISTLVNRITVTDPFFGVAFYIGNWIFIGMCLLSVVLFFVCARRTDAVRLDDSDVDE